ncbi:hypothetical protein [Paraburkholderia lacunae]|uniref:Uncharacterized protein n=1 Tax=Paraburkholderia lacunae TaxID=2211104 RepID=A0A370NCE2_9BURK|nr:hypothetical protein [Paraburkholderia lacunae]RDK03198.1 hypothetical protein DLM46_09975 [Paraburkholderia lacunae]
MMAALRFAALLVLLTAGCSPAWPNAGFRPAPTAQTAQTDTPPPTPAAANDQRHAAPPKKAPVLSVGVSDPDTRLILPWFLTDIINAINTPTSASDFLRTFGHGL